MLRQLGGVFGLALAGALLLAANDPTANRAGTVQRSATFAAFAAADAVLVCAASAAVTGLLRAARRREPFVRGGADSLVKQFVLRCPGYYGGAMVHVREMVEADIEAVSTIRVRGWQAAYAGVVPQTYLDAMTVEGDAGQRRQWFSQPGRESQDLVALGDRGPVGWICFGPYRGEMPGLERAGEIYALYISPDLIGQGIGRLLLGETHAQMKGQGFETSALWVLSDNQRARRFYERAGYQADGVTQDDVYDGITLTELRYQRVL
ncbi:GNAT family N-acetyltransferase [Streptomyces rochei]|uniref:GNAT family N-acetyltransferase n=1 Tax=Streptomyces rochei TaxID=1928 RepID=UPI00369ED37C